MALLKNDTLALRALEPEDLEYLFRWENNSAIWSCSGSTISPYSRYVLKEYIAQSHLGIYEQKQLRLIIELMETKKPIGMIDLYDFDPHNRKAGVGILLDTEHQGNGMATNALHLLTDYAFSFLKIHQLYAYVAINNEPSKSLFLRCGFTISGTLSDWISTEKGYSDVLIMQYIQKL
ncbi:diamine N-acetyltransferase [Parabacteroides sp. PF5-5]|uniref:GNAT family N-acetyltransferase n=1 Tax=unclassified Parabacteroides TaxID=2649774 RepID=UPI00247391AE|nr:MULTISPECIES: GNAT family N-acetyltransferase [unclassified Parabacteroides]MDH6306351.1 diamine N-acetyltransferase [Parabacteroides sp. PH5-39]MDH6314623.1 diamine N-acetyltransferase [Parabacteroides sp. PF5-13]MDH6321062.1 diamine N-acetyltransferase [Parabacteroides sp. PH5-13]MDH6324794.1 diamine N-acetyltransferase [Parabacteroides sp. PH5-8]MDH6325525.1 diamine N-acetyltransferase [Parabacteroides sp. PH5-41]